MKILNMPKFLHEVFGEKARAAELLLVLLFGLGMSAAVLAGTYSEWQGLAFWRVFLLALLLLDICGGVVANVTWGTNAYYSGNSRARLVFILVHIQPLLLALVFGGGWTACLLVWAYAAAAALLLHRLPRHPAQRTAGMVLVCTGLGGLLLLFGGLPSILLLTLAFYLLKVVWSFAVDHYHYAGMEA